MGGAEGLSPESGGVRAPAASGSPQALPGCALLAWFPRLWMVSNSKREDERQESTVTSVTDNMGGGRHQGPFS